jgi:hypothetical protein
MREKHGEAGGAGGAYHLLRKGKPIGRNTVKVKKAA